MKRKLSCVHSIFWISMICILGLSHSCQRPSNKPLNAEYLGVFTATLPCADCEGLQYRINLGEDGRYVSTSIYLGKSKKPFRAEGEYAFENPDRIVLNPGMDDQQFLQFENNGFWWLDQTGNRINGNLAAYYRISRAVPDQKDGHVSVAESTSGFVSQSGPTENQEGSEIYLKKWNSGSTFFAFGNEPFWSLDWILPTGWTFKTADGYSITLPHSEGIVFADSGMTRYDFSDQGHLLRLNIYEEKCTDNMSGTVFDFRVEAMLVPKGAVSARRYQGCGSFATEPLLHDLWAMTSWQGRAISARDYPKGGPMMEINLVTRQVMGTDGCNRFSGTITTNPEGIHFGSLAGTKMACQGDLPGYNWTQQVSDQYLSYHLLDGVLTLIKDEQELARFKHFD